MNWTRTHTCGELRAADVGRDVVVCGWVNRNRDHGGLTFVDLRDRYGMTQVVIDAQSAAADVARELRAEYVVAVRGVVRARPGEMANRDLPTGEIEIAAATIEVLATAKTTPFPIDSDLEPTEELKFRYRYLDLRRAPLQRAMAVRHHALLAARRYLDGEGFLEIETPLLIKTTPEGARDYVVPSRLHPGRFYALPQSPQIYKQLLMVAGFDRYFQVARCLRDEDLRADRQPEFTQIDLEMSFPTEDQVFAITEGIVGAMCEAAGLPRPAALPRFTYDDAMTRFGSDKPDVRFELELCDVSAVFAGTGFNAFAAALAAGGRVRALRAPGGARLSRKDIDDLTAAAQKQGAKGLAWLKLEADAVAAGGIAKFVTADEIAALSRLTGAAAGDLLLFVADTALGSALALGQVRLALRDKLALPLAAGLHFCWVHRFAMFEAAPDSPTGWAPAHHMFTMPEAESLFALESDPGSVRAQLYDLVCNGVELGSGSIRIHRPELQRRVMRQVGLGDAEIDDKFGFMLQAFEFGAPPHGGIALGVDRLVMLLVGGTSLREVIAFPKTQRATSPMDGAPSPIAAHQLRELSLAVVAPPPAQT